MTIFKANLRLVILFYFWLYHLSNRQDTHVHARYFFDRLSNPDKQGIVSLNIPNWLRRFYMSIN